MAEIGMAFMAPIQARQKMLIEAAAAPVDLAARQAATTLNTANAAQMQQHMQDAQALRAITMSSLAQQPAAGAEAPNQSDQLSTLGNALLSQGFYKEGTAALAQGALVDSRGARAAATTQKTEFDKAKWYLERVGGVMNQSDLDRTNELFQQIFPGATPSVTKYDTNVVRNALRSSMTTAQRLMAENRDERLSVYVASLAQQEDARRERLRLADLELNRRVEADANRAKAGAKGTGGRAPSTAAPIAKATTLAMKDDPDASKLEGTEAMAARLTIAQEADRLIKADPSLNYDQAARAALLTAKKRGDFSVEKGMFSDKVRYSAKGLRVEDPAPLPPTKDKLAAGRFYQTKQGPALWNGTAFVKD